MFDLDNQIARLELRAEQVVMHLQQLGRNVPDAASARSELYAILQKLAELKSERRRRYSMLAMGTAAYETPNRSPLPKPQSAASAEPASTKSSSRRV